ncbi:MAG: GNAT family N-acetyltransferase [Micavibrio aeruginosavorus]|uniref:GNAT family N-acetyltransferase n=1 Tax=Micavibrio aeruginosavorus TaxID=349221 RepID=A0A7T5R1Q9_9BACT|nr:MAG: GNAT family N-acetyltransferase [Micavibrio aeruginosavorus]
MTASINTQSHFNNAAAHAKPVTIETPRLILRETQHTDIDSFRDITTRPDFYYYCFDGSENKLREFMDVSVRTQTPDPSTGLREKFMLAVTLKDSGKVIGHASLMRIEEYTLPMADVDYEAAYFIDSHHNGHGYGQEALLNTMHYGFSELGLPGLGSVQELDNAKAIAIASKVLGFKKVGECVGQTVKGPKQHQVCIVVPDDFYPLRANDKQVYIAPDALLRANRLAATALDSKPSAP